VLGRTKWIEETLQPFIRNTGPALSPFNAWVLLKSLETLPLRVEASCARAAAVADYLAGHPAVSRVWYPSREDHPQHALAMRQMSAGGTLVTFELDGKAAAFRMLNALRLIAISNNLGDARSMVTHPATTTHMRIGAEERARLGIGEGVIRLSVGLEDIADLLSDLETALSHVG
jgi:O-succinylhomoserine sulfhydrylase